MSAAVPLAMPSERPDLHEADAALEQASGGQALAPEGVLLFGDVDLLGPDLGRVIDAIAGQRLLGLIGQVERVGCGELHLGGELIAADAGFEPRVAGSRIRVGPV